MSENDRYALMGLWLLLGVVAICVASVKGCGIMNNPETIRADAETRIKLHEAFR